MWGKLIFFIFLFFTPPENIGFWLMCYGCKQLLGHIQFNIRNAHFPKNECTSTQVHKNLMVISPLVINIFSRNLHHWIQHIQSYPCQKLNFYEISRIVPSLRAGHILLSRALRGGWTQSRMHKKWACCPIYMYNIIFITLYKVQVMILKP